MSGSMRNSATSTASEQHNILKITQVTSRFSSLPVPSLPKVDKQLLYLTNFHKAYHAQYVKENKQSKAASDQGRGRYHDTGLLKTRRLFHGQRIVFLSKQHLFI